MLDDRGPSSLLHFSGHLTRVHCSPPKRGSRLWNLGQTQSSSDLGQSCAIVNFDREQPPSLSLSVKTKKEVLRAECRCRSRWFELSNLVVVVVDGKATTPLGMVEYPSEGGLFRRPLIWQCPCKPL